MPYPLGRATGEVPATIEQAAATLVWWGTDPVSIAAVTREPWWFDGTKDAVHAAWPAVESIAETGLYLVALDRRTITLAVEVP